MRNMIRETRLNTEGTKGMILRRELGTVERVPGVSNRQIMERLEQYEQVCADVEEARKYAKKARKALGMRKKSPDRVRSASHEAMTIRWAIMSEHRSNLELRQGYTIQDATKKLYDYEEIGLTPASLRTVICEVQRLEQVSLA